MKDGFTGTQRGMTQEQKEALVLVFERRDVSEFHHGDCIGADAEAHNIAREFGAKIVGHPPTIETKRAFCLCDVTRSALPYLERNSKIVEETVVLIAAPKDDVEVIRSGTRSTVRRARRANKLVVVLFPDGRFETILPKNA